jgi:hypothetical protein
VIGLASSLSSALVGSAAATSAAPPLVLGARGDESAVRRIVAANDVDTVVPQVGWQGWIQDVVEASVRWVGELIGRSLRAVGVTTPGLEWAAAVVVALALALLGVVVFRAVRRRRPPRPTEAAVHRPSAEAAPRDAQAWRRRLEVALSAGDVPGALEAAWWWLARSLGAEVVDPAWTSGELVRRCRREDLRPAVGVLDGLAYGPCLPSVVEVRTLVARLEGALQ